MGAEVVEIVRHNGPVSQYILKRQSEYLTYAKSRSTKHKIMKFLMTNSKKLQAARKSKTTKREMKKEAMKREEDSDLVSMPYSWERSCGSSSSARTRWASLP